MLYFRTESHYEPYVLCEALFETRLDERLAFCDSRDYVSNYNSRSTYFPQRVPNKQFSDYACRKWCDEEHIPPLSGKCHGKTDFESSFGDLFFTNYDPKQYLPIAIGALMTDFMSLFAPSASDYTAQTMPDLFEERRRTLYGPLRPCESIHRVDYTWKDDYSPQGKFPGWCLKGKAPSF
ncbi:uncharacterized protein CEXT_635171 [Caerostris extrusa]|uniref:Uncharacterized protein n=1 Tax=Caerostris extrusa TaxID=172846 RepID=A0AAV4UP20_CAEEX|nr:uncharacterized protein CEXT_635171 [Caerostris extrusa]